jgi:hypothetical protein
LPKGIINFTNSGANSRGHTVERNKNRKVATSHEPREESLRRKVKVMQIISNLEKEEDHTQQVQPAQPQNQGVDFKELSFLL